MLTTNNRFPTTGQSTQDLLLSPTYEYSTCIKYKILCQQIRTEYANHLDRRQFQPNSGNFTKDKRMKWNQNNVDEISRTLKRRVRKYLAQLNEHEKIHTYYIQGFKWEVGGCVGNRNRKHKKINLEPTLALISFDKFSITWIWGHWYKNLISLWWFCPALEPCRPVWVWVR